MKRRDFVFRSVWGSLAFTLPNFVLAKSDVLPNVINPHKDVLALFEKTKKKSGYISMTGIDPTADFMYNRENGDIGAVRPGVAFFNDDFESAVIDVPIFPHSIEQNPNYPNRIMLIPRRLQTCVEFDVIENKVVSEITLKEKKFYGHGCYVPGTDLFYASTFMKGSSDASMVIFDYKQNKILKEIEIPGGAGSHQCSVSRDGKCIIITFSQATKDTAPSMAWFDIKTGELVDRVFGIEQHAEHFSELSDGNIVYTGGQLPENGIFFPTVFGHITKDKKIVKHVPEKTDSENIFVGQGVGIVGFEPRTQYLVTNLSNEKVYLFDYSTEKCIKFVKVKRPRGVSISADGKKAFVTSPARRFNSNSYVSVIDMEKFEVVDQFRIKNSLAFSSHTNYFKLTN